jgi:hypothetical protein
MNCFEVRQDFVGFWQRTLDDQRRRELLDHLKGCSKCDRSFRGFALTAPMLHSRSATAAASTSSAMIRAAREGLDISDASPQAPHLNMNGVRSADAQRAAEIVRRASLYRLAASRPSPAWRYAAAGFSAAAAAMMLVYFSVAAPSQSFDEAFINSDSIYETAAQPDADFLGQQIPPIPAVGGDLAG